MQETSNQSRWFLRHPSGGLLQCNRRFEKRSYAMAIAGQDAFRAVVTHAGLEALRNLDPESVRPLDCLFMKPSPSVH